MERLAGRSAVVTGAAGSIGTGIARRLAAESARLLLVDLAGEALDRLTAEIRAIGADCESLHLDLADRAAPAQLADQCRERFGGLDIMINNAGIGGSRSVQDLDDADWDRMIDVNLSMVFRLCRATLPLLLASPQGRIVNISSVLALVGMNGSANYSAAKAGIAGLTRAMACDYAAHGLTVNAIAPGLIDSPMARHNLATKPFARQIMYGTTPIRRIGRASDIAATVAFLVSDDASFITGQVIAVDGGWSVTKFVAPDTDEIM